MSRWGSGSHAHSERSCKVLHSSHPRAWGQGGERGPSRGECRHWRGKLDCTGWEMEEAKPAEGGIPCSDFPSERRDRGRQSEKPTGKGDFPSASGARVRDEAVVIQLFGRRCVGTNEADIETKSFVPLPSRWKVRRL